MANADALSAEITIIFNSLQEIGPFTSSLALTSVETIEATKNPQAPAFITPIGT
jgi:hypothetical protein